MVGHLFSLTQEAVQGLGRREEECIFFLETWLLSTLFTLLSLPMPEKAGVWREPISLCLSDLEAVPLVLTEKKSHLLGLLLTQIFEVLWKVMVESDVLESLEWWWMCDTVGTCHGTQSLC